MHDGGDLSTYAHWDQEGKNPRVLSALRNVYKTPVPRLSDARPSLRRVTIMAALYHTGSRLSSPLIAPMRRCGP